MESFDIGIIGAGVAGAFACYKIAKDFKDIKAVVFDIGRPPMKRRRQLEGWLGCLPNSDGKLYENNLSNVTEVTNIKKTKSAHSFVQKTLSEIGDFDLTIDKSPQASIKKIIAKNGFDLKLNNFTQIYPKDIHALSKHISDTMDNSGNINYQFDDEVRDIYKKNGMFVIVSEYREIQCKKIIFAVGRSGWRWANKVYKNFGIVESNDISKFGIRVEMTSSSLKEFNKSNCTLTKNNLEIGPFSWFGTVIPEDHLDMAISAFRANENRWKTDKVSFQIIGEIEFPNEGIEQTNRLAGLTFLLSNDRIIKERVSSILNHKSKISVIKEYNWLNNVLTDLMNIIPELPKAYFHVPTIMPLVPKINIDNNLSTDIDGFFVVGEAAGLHGILSAATTGVIAANEACK